jgi:hypothetical protein
MKTSIRRAVLRPVIIVCLGGLCALFAGKSAAVPPDVAQGTVPFHHGIAYVSWWHDLYESSASDSSLALLAATGAGWVSILLTGYQDTETSTSVYRDPQRTPSDTGLLQAIDRAHAMGLQVVLKPHIDCQNGAWRGMIEFGNEPDWTSWFVSYGTFLNHYAELAETAKVEQFCVGCEFCRTAHRTADWLTVIAEVRARFSGLITYAANWDNYAAVTFWDALDYVGIDGYFELTDLLDPAPAELLAAWVPWEADIAAFAQSTDQKIVFTEIGYRSVDGANIYPWQWSTGGTIDLQEQADCYEAALQTFWHRDYFRGFFWWAWEVDPEQGGPTDDGYTPYGKPAADVLASWYEIMGVPDLEDPQPAGPRWRIPAPLRAGQEIVFWWEAGSRSRGVSRYPRAREHLGIEVFDLQGRTCLRLRPDARGGERYAVRWPGEAGASGSVTPGAYFLRLLDGRRFHPPMRVLFTGD